MKKYQSMSSEEADIRNWLETEKDKVKKRKILDLLEEAKKEPNGGAIVGIYLALKEDYKTNK